MSATFCKFQNEIVASRAKPIENGESSSTYISASGLTLPSVKNTKSKFNKFDKKEKNSNNEKKKQDEHHHVSNHSSDDEHEPKFKDSFRKEGRRETRWSSAKRERPSHPSMNVSRNDELQINMVQLKNDIIGEVNALLKKSIDAVVDNVNVVNGNGVAILDYAKDVNDRLVKFIAYEKVEKDTLKAHLQKLTEEVNLLKNQVTESVAATKRMISDNQSVSRQYTDERYCTVNKAIEVVAKNLQMFRESEETVKSQDKLAFTDISVNLIRLETEFTSKLTALNGSMSTLKAICGDSVIKGEPNDGNSQKKKEEKKKEKYRLKKLKQQEKYERKMRERDEEKNRSKDQENENERTIKTTTITPFKSIAPMSTDIKRDDDTEVKHKEHEEDALEKSNEAQAEIDNETADNDELIDVTPEMSEVNSQFRIEAAENEGYLNMYLLEGTEFSMNQEGLNNAGTMARIAIDGEAIFVYKNTWYRYKPVQQKEVLFPPPIKSVSLVVPEIPKISALKI